MLKLYYAEFRHIEPFAAASARLCVETNTNSRQSKSIAAAASARLCVETFARSGTRFVLTWQPPPRGCVLKHKVAVNSLTPAMMQPPPRGCVLKQPLAIADLNAW